MTAGRFTQLSHPTFAHEWLTRPLDRLFAADSRINGVRFNLWPIALNNDHANIELEGEVQFTGQNGMVHSPGMPTQEEMDEISAVRALERQAARMWEYLPILVEDDGEVASVNGTHSLSITRDTIEFSFDSFDRGPDGVEMRIICRFEDGLWETRDWLVIAQYPGTLSDMLVRDPASILDAVGVDAIGLKTMPQVIAATLDEVGRLVVDLAPGEFTRCMDTR